MINETSTTETNTETKLYLIAVESGGEFDKHLNWTIAQGQIDQLGGLIHCSTTISDSVLLGAEDVADNFEAEILNK